MGFARSAFAVSAVLAAFVATGTAGGVQQRRRGVRVARVEQISNEVVPGDSWVSSTVHFTPDGSVVAAFMHDHSSASGPPPILGTHWRRLNADGTMSDPKGAPTFGITCWSPQGALFLFDDSNLVRVDTDGTTSSAPLDAGGYVSGISEHDGSVYLLTIHQEAPEESLWWQRFTSDGSAAAPAVRVSRPADPTLPGHGLRIVSGASIDVDASGAAFVVWSSYTYRDGGVYDRQVQWRRIDADGSESSSVTVIDGLPEGPRAAAVQDYYIARLAGDGTTWVLPQALYAAAGAFDAIGVRRDGVLLPPGKLLPDASSVAANENIAVATDAVGGLHVVLRAERIRGIRDGLVVWGKSREVLSILGPDAAVLRSRRLGGSCSPFRHALRAGIELGPVAVAPDGSSLLLVYRKLRGGRRATEFLHLDAVGGRLSHGRINSGFLFGGSDIAVTQVDGRTRFAVAWTARETTEGPTQTFAAILE